MKQALIEAWHAGDPLAARALADLLEEEGHPDAAGVRRGQVWLLLDGEEWRRLAAVEEGWEVFHCDGSAAGLYQIQKIDEADRFDEDNQVWAFVWQRALRGDRKAAAALAFVRRHGPAEYRLITLLMLACDGCPGVYVPGSVGRSTCELFGCDDLGMPAAVPERSLWRVGGPSEDHSTPGHPAVLYTIVLLDEATRRDDPRNISYEGAHYGDLILEPNRPVNPEYAAEYLAEGGTD